MDALCHLYHYLRGQVAPCWWRQAAAPAGAEFRALLAAAGLPSCERTSLGEGGEVRKRATPACRHM